MVRIISLFLLVYTSFAFSYVEQSKYLEKRGKYFYFELQFYGEMRKLPLVLFDVEGGRLVKRGHSRTIRGYTLTYKLKKKGPKLKVKNLHYYGRSGKRKHLNDISEKRTSYNRYKQPQVQQANVDILIDIETTDFVHGKG